MATIRELTSDELDQLAKEDDNNTASSSDNKDTCRAVDKCLEVLNRAKTDTERFAALLLVTKLVQADDTDDVSRRKIFDGVGFTFLNRLLKTDKVPEGCESTMYQSLAVTLLACFSTDSDLVTHPQMLNKVVILKDIILNARLSVESTEKKSLVEDSFQILVAMATQNQGRKQILEDGIVPALCDICQHSYFGCAEAFQLLEMLLEVCGEEIWQTDQECLNDLLGSMSSDFKDIQDEKKFILCGQLTTLVVSSSGMVTQENASWVWDIHHGLSDILKSKTGQSQRNLGLKLASHMICHLGVSWALGPHGNDKKLLLLMINLACIEVRMGLEDGSQYASTNDVLPACYSVLESCIEFMTCGPILSLDEKQVLQLHNAMTGAFGAVLFFLKENQEDPDKVDDPLVRATVRVLSVWLAEETAALRNQVYEVLPFVLSIIEKSFEEIQLQSPDLQDEPIQTMVAQSPLSKLSSIKVDLLRLMLPALCHLTAEQEPREILVTQGAMEMCGTYFSYQWKQFIDKQGDQPEVALITLCNIFLNVALQDVEAVKQAEVFTELYGLLANVLPKLAKQHETLVLSFNMAVLGLTLLKTLCNSPKLDVSESKRFTVAAIQMFGNSHQCGNSGQCEIAPIYRQHWEDIVELWMLGMQLLSECVSVLPWIAGVFLQCGWLTTTDKLLTDVTGGRMDEETCSMYTVVLSSLCKHSKDVHSELNQSTGLDVARKHNMVDLAVVLQAPPPDGVR